MQDTLLIEILTEELPTKLLQILSDNFSQGIFNGLDQNCLLTTESKVTAYATPRRLAVSITAVLDAQSERQIERKGPAVAAANDDSGKATRALQGFARSCGVAIDDLQQGPDNKGVLCYIYKHKQPGQSLGSILIKVLQDLLPKMPVTKVMRWGIGDTHFVRPVHNFFMIHGKNVLREPEALLGLRSTKAETLGHRFLGKTHIVIPHASEYENVLREKGYVIASFEKRKQLIREKLLESSKKEYGEILRDESLLDEVTALVEYPEVYAGGFSQVFLDVPQECLILSMKKYQKYFPLLDSDGNLLPRFLIVSNIKTDNPSNIIHGNERVLQARLADAKFFFDQDRKKTLASRVEGLSRVVYHNKLGMQSDRVDRVRAIAQEIGLQLGGKALAKQADEVAKLAKADLLTDMVGEFPELQGVMGRYYAKHEGMGDDIAFAIEDHYKPRFADDDLPRNMIGICVALADKMEVLVGMFGVGQIPTGDKDPFALRRHAFGVVRMLIQKHLNISLYDLVSLTEKHMPQDIRVDPLQVVDFLLDKARRYFIDQGNNYHAIESVISPYGSASPLGVLADFIPSATKFLLTEDGRILANANKRITNILKKSGQEVTRVGYPLDGLSRPDPNLFESDVEVNLWNALQEIGKKSEALKSEKRFAEALEVLVSLAPPVKEFFDQVLVNAEDLRVRNNRFLLLQCGRVYMNQVADLSLMVS
ncbi:MAG: glycine--tRNA ligase subunit beta [Proteobacteria bacterium]|nr:glycine--tRNA ligase subunit beta [Pseudomonadota bacterium]